MANILVVDDSRVVRKLIISILSTKNHDCLEAENGFDALEQIVQNDVDLIIADLNMPKMTGLELVKTIRRSSEYNYIPILMLTTEQSDESKRMCIEAGANIYLSKPVPPDHIIAEVDSLLSEVKH